MGLGKTTQSAQSNMIYGALWCIGGTVFTLISLASASGPSGGRYVVAWGAILFGGIQFLQGLFQLAGSGRPATPATLPENISLPTNLNASHKVQTCVAALEQLGCQVNTIGVDEWEVEIPDQGKRFVYDENELEALTTELIRNRPMA